MIFFKTQSDVNFLVNSYNFLKKNIYLVASLCIILYLNIDILFFILTKSTDELSPYPAFVLDGHSYLKGALWMIDHDSYLYTPDTYHSPGAQIWISWLFRLTSTIHPAVVKIANFLIFIGIQILAYRLALRYLPRNICLFLTILLASSLQFKIYIGTLQYEVLLTLIITWFVFLFSKVQRVSMLYVVVTVCIAYISFLLRYHFIYLTFICILFLIKNKDLKLLLIFFIPTFTLIIGTSLVYYKGSGSYSKISTDSSRQLRWLTPNSTGENYPYPVETIEYEPGFHYIVDRPYDYLKQLSRRFQYLFSLKPDSYFIRTRLGVMLSNSYLFDIVLSYAFLLLVIFGQYFSFKKNRGLFNAYCFVSFIIFLPHFIIGSSSRFIMPLFVFHLLFSCIGGMGVSSHFARRLSINKRGLKK